MLVGLNGVTGLNIRAVNIPRKGGGALCGCVPKEMFSPTKITILGVTKEQSPRGPHPLKKLLILDVVESRAELTAIIC